MELKTKTIKSRVPVSTHIDPDTYDQLIALIAGKTSVSDAIRQLIHAFILGKNKD